jgi:TusA-related sulfurtransferase
MDLMCSGAARNAAVFDAGDLGCADGLAAEFRRRIAEVEPGRRLVTVVRDTAAISDLPPLARLLGHRVYDVRRLGSGRVAVTVERVR